MNIRNGCTRLVGACLATVALSTLSACADTDPEGKQLTIKDLQPLEAGEFAPPYDKQHTVGTKCRLVTYSFVVSGATLYEYVLYGSGGKNDVVTKSRGAEGGEVSSLLNNFPPRCA